MKRVFFALLLVSAARLVTAQVPFTPELGAKIDSAVRDVIARTGVPSASVGIVVNGQVVYTKAFGKARLQPPLDATADMHYAIGSISKQFTAACVLLLQEEGKLDINDPIGKHFPELTRASEVTIRHILSHTSGYRDYAPQDYTIPAWTKPTTAQAIVHEWATLPLDFDPGTQYQYSNTNFVIAGSIVEKVSGEPFWSFLSRRILKPLGMARTINLDVDHDKVQPVGYMRNALGPLRPAIIEAPGWYFADAQMAMPVGDLLTWDISLMIQSLLKPSSYALMETEVKLKNGDGARYGLGVSLGTRDGHRVVSHGGEVGGFVASNTVFPDDKIAIAVLTNEEASPAAGSIARAITGLLLPTSSSSASAAEDRAKTEAQVKQMLTGFQQGKIDRTLFTADGNFYFNDVALADFQNSLAPLGGVQSVTQASSSLRGGMTFRVFDVAFANGTKVRVTAYITKDGKYEQFLVEPAV